MRTYRNFRTNFDKCPCCCHLQNSTSSTSIRGAPCRMIKNRLVARSCLPGKHFSKKNLALLNALCHAEVRQRAALIQTADKSLIKCICECALNVLQDKVSINRSQKARLQRHKTVLRHLIKSSGNKTRPENLWRSKKHIIVQNGGSFLPLLLGPLLSTLFSSILKK